MKTSIVLLILFFLIVPVVYLFILGKKSETGEAPGLIENQLSRCPGTPNCVCSEYSDDVDHYIEPVREAVREPVRGHNALTSDSIVKTLEQLGGEVQTQTADYVSAIFVSELFGFVDDVELRIDHENAVIHLRSASRVGRSDLGTNLQRVEKIKQSLQVSD